MDTALQMLLKKIASERTAPLPEPAAPVGNLGPLSNDTSLAFRAQNPEPVPPAYTQPAAPDMNFVNQYAGVAPERPVEQQPSFMQKLGAILGGVGAGFQGNGPQFVEQIRRTREEPFRRYDAQMADYEGRRTRAIEVAERRAIAEADALNRANEQIYERDFKVWLQKNGDRSDEQKQRMAQAFTLRRDARAAQLQEEAEQRRERRQQEQEARQTADQYFGLTGNKALSDEIGRYRAGLKDSLSPAAARLEQRVIQLGDARMGRAIAGGSGGRTRAVSNAAVEALQRFELSKQGLIGALQRGDNKSAAAFREAMNRNYKSLARFPGQIRLATTNPDWPHAELQSAPTAAPQQQPQAPQPQADPLGILK